MVRDSGGGGGGAARGSRRNNHGSHTGVCSGALCGSRGRRSRKGRPRRGGHIYLSGLSVSHRRRPADKFSSAAIYIVDDVVRAGRDGVRAGRLPARGRGRVPVLLLRRLHVYWVASHGDTPVSGPQRLTALT